MSRRAERHSPGEKGRFPLKKQPVSFICRFLLCSAATLIPVSLFPESWYTPLNQATARLVGDLLKVFISEAVVRQTHVMLGRFSVNVIAECSAVHLIVLYIAFLIAFPANNRQKSIGIITGIAVLFSVNIIRIAVVTWIGSKFPTWFNVIHIYLGQLAMLMTMVAICMGWCRWISYKRKRRADSAMGFVVRFLLFSSVPFLLWLHLNQWYIGAIDNFIHWLFGLAGYQLKIIRAHEYYYQTFSLVALIGFIMAVSGARPLQRLRWVGFGIASLTFFQVVFRMCNVWISAFNMGWIVFLSQLSYNLSVYGLPVTLALVLYWFKERRRDPLEGLT